MTVYQELQLKSGRFQSSDPQLYQSKRQDAPYGDLFI